MWRTTACVGLLPGSFYNIGSLEPVQRGHSGLFHNEFKLAPEEVQNLLDARLPERGQSPEIRPADAHCPRTQRQRLEDVCSATKAAIDQNRNAASDCFDHFR